MTPPELDLDTVREFHQDFLKVMSHGTNEERRKMVRFFVDSILLHPADESAVQQNEPAVHELVLTFKAMPTRFVKAVGAGACFVSMHQLCLRPGW